MIEKDIATVSEAYPADNRDRLKYIKQFFLKLSKLFKIHKKLNTNE
jgi:hypothetical protein